MDIIVIINNGKATLFENCCRTKFAAHSDFAQKIPGKCREKTP
jgi:hypothetical protein